VLSAGAIYRLVAVDVLRTESKASHIARLVTLPPACEPARVGDVALPPLLIFNLQLPSYAPGIFGPSDGPGESVIYYFALRDDFDPAAFPNKAALGLLARFVANGREADGGATRDRLKLIARVANVEEWAEAAPLSTPEYRLLVSYNEKPLLTRPQVPGVGASEEKSAAPEGGWPRRRRWLRGGPAVQGCATQGFPCPCGLFSPPSPFSPTRSFTLAP
jgi:hypothetical protein